MRAVTVALLGLALTSLLQAEPLRPPIAVAQKQDESTGRLVYLTTILKDPLHNIMYQNVMRYWGDGIPTWVRRFNSTGDATQNEARFFLLDRQKFQIARIRQPHTVNPSYLYVVFNDFEAGGPVAWGYYVDASGSGRWIGVPPIAVAEKVEQLSTLTTEWD